MIREVRDLEFPRLYFYGLIEGRRHKFCDFLRFWKDLSCSRYGTAKLPAYSLPSMARTACIEMDNEQAETTVRVYKLSDLVQVMLPKYGIHRISWLTPPHNTSGALPPLRRPRAVRNLQGPVGCPRATIKFS
jgi:hypothetical protein